MWFSILLIRMLCLVENNLHSFIKRFHLVEMLLVPYVPYLLFWFTRVAIIYRYENWKQPPDYTENWGKCGFWEIKKILINLLVFASMKLDSWETFDKWKRTYQWSFLCLTTTNYLYYQLRNLSLIETFHPTKSPFFLR